MRREPARRWSSPRSALLLGARSDAGVVRTGTSRARISGRVQLDPSAEVATRLEEAGADLDDDAVILARTVSAEGRSRAQPRGSGRSRRHPGLGRVRPGRRARPERPASAAPAGPTARDPRRVRRREARGAVDDVLRDVRPADRGPRAARRHRRAPPRARAGGRRAPLRPRRGRGSRPQAG